ncbi:hypothetical protein MicvaDRAFT_3598 [Microcoleus vaginatus FGP-2]|nr:hypothetical protein MicvaDRAFT_3598 [Microcoleus vaginatus FGP-2]
MQAIFLISALNSNFKVAIAVLLVVLREFFLVKNSTISLTNRYYFINETGQN